MERRSFIRRGTLTVSLAGSAGEVLSFLPDGFYENAPEWPKTLPFRKDEKPRDVKEIIPGFLWLDAADFAEYGGWALDTQFAAFMGSSYLIAHGTREPVKDALTNVKINAPGTYRLWVRSKNWMPEHSPGQFSVAVNGQASGSLFGAQPESEWGWQDGGSFDLKAGMTELSLRDTTGFFGRCSSMILTRDMDYTPPGRLDKFYKERSRLIGVSADITDLGAYDVVVTGAGPAGCCAAVAAARLGVKVALVNDRPVLGGNASDEIGVPIQGAATHFKKLGIFMRETGVVEEAVRIAQANDWWHNMSRAFQMLVDQEPNITLFKDTRLVGAKMDGTTIRSVQTMDTLQGTRSQIRGRMFVDGTGDGWLGYYAGAEFRLGREAFSEFKEPFAPKVADNYTMSGCLRGPIKQYKHCQFMRSIEHDSPQPLKRQPWFYTFDDEWQKTRGNFGSFSKDLKDGTWWMEHRGSVDDLWQPEEARDELLRIYASFWNYLKNDWKHKDLAANYELDYIPFTNGKRESRRLLGDHVLTQNELQKPVLFRDAICHTGWPIDLHALEGIFDLGGPFYVKGGNDGKAAFVPPGAQIPFGSLYSRNISNLLMGGRCMSTTHLGLGSVRVEAQCCLTGQVAGTGAALAARHRITPRKLRKSHMEEIQQTLLKQDVYIPYIPHADPADLTRRAKVTASSVESGEHRPGNVVNGWGRPLEGDSNMWMSSSQETCPQWIQLAFRRSVRCNAIYCTFDTNLKPNAWDSGKIPPHCIKDYRLECRVNGQWKTVVEVQGNYQRQRRHQFPAVRTDAIRLTALATNGIRCSRVFEISAYNEPA